jgi:hypothetical protein
MLKTILKSLSNNKFAQFFALLLITLCIGIFNSPYTHEPDVDVEVYRNVGMHITKGYLPYKDVFDHKGPVIFYIAALVHYFGIWGNWLFGIICAAFASYLLLLISKHFSLSSIWVLPILFLLTLIWQREFYGKYGDTRFFSTIFLIAVFYLVIVKPKSLALIKGLMAGLIFLTQQNEILPCAILLLYNLLQLYKTKRLLIKTMLISFLGFCILPIFLIIYYAANNALDDLYFGFIGFNKKYLVVASINDHLNGIKYIYNKSFLPKFLIICFVSFLVSLVFKKHNNTKNLILLVLCLSLVSLYNITLSGYYLLYYSFHLVLPCILLILLTLINIKHIIITNIKIKAFYAFTIFIFTSAVIRRSIWANFYETFQSKKFQQTTYNSKYVDVISYIKKLPKNKQSIFIFNATPALAIPNKLELISPSKWTLNYFWNNSASQILHFDTLGVIFKKEIIESLKEKKPSIIISNGDYSKSPVFIPNINTIWRNFIDSNYRFLMLCESHPEFVVYKLKTLDTLNEKSN